MPELALDADTDRVPNRLIFVGNFSSNPSNTDAMAWFCHEVLPLVQKEVPGVHLQIVGNKPSDEVKTLTSKTVEVTGFVPETAPYLLASSVSICPLRFGAGLKGKIGEAMMYGLPVVTTTIGTQGMDVRHGENMMVGDTPAEFAAGCVALLKDKKLRIHLTQNGRRFIIDNYSYAAVHRTVDAVVSRLDTLPLRGYGNIERWARLQVDGVKEYLRWRFGK
ncbi:MAG TPA: glycosyltransferase [Gammaproteobacteria bacterium]|nr:glycosyltransferase [Gammaproteobacteria bacterium]